MEKYCDDSNQGNVGVELIIKTEETQISDQCNYIFEPSSIIDEPTRDIEQGNVPLDPSATGSFEKQEIKE